MDLTRYVGFYRGVHTNAAQRDDTSSSRETAQIFKSTPPGLRAEGLMITPATTYRRPFEQEIPMMLDTTLVDTQPAAPLSFRSPRFHEHLANSEGLLSPALSPRSNVSHTMFIDSPTLGLPQSPRSPTRKVKRNRHSLAWNNYDQDGASVRQHEPDHGEFGVSPSDSWDKSPWR